jgi:cytoskeletal protein RodZ
MIGRRGEGTPSDPPRPKGFDDYDLRLGDIMRGERATLGKSLLDVQRELKIKATYIAAIENADPTAFETPGFVAGYVRSYARYLGLDPEWAFQKFCDEGKFAVLHGMAPGASGTRSKRGAAVPEPRDHLRDPFENPAAPYFPKAPAIFASVEPGALGSIAVLVAMILGLGYGGWSLFQEVQRVQLTPVDQPPGVVASVDPLSPAPRVAVPGEAAAAAAEEIAAAPPREAMERLYGGALDTPVVESRDGPIAAIDPTSVGVVTAGLAERNVTAGGSVGGIDAALAEALGIDGAGVEVADAAVQVTAAPPEVVIFAVRPSWVRVQAQDGTVLFEKILDGGERYVLPRLDAPARLRAGNAGSLYFGVNGQTLGPAGGPGAVVREVALSVEALTQSYQLADVAADADLAQHIALAQAAEPPAE